MLHCCPVYKPKATSASEVQSSSDWNSGRLHIVRLGDGELSKRERHNTELFCEASPNKVGPQTWDHKIERGICRLVRDLVWNILTSACWQSVNFCTILTAFTQDREEFARAQDGEGECTNRTLHCVGFPRWVFVEQIFVEKIWQQLCRYAPCYATCCHQWSIPRNRDLPRLLCPNLLAQNKLPNLQPRIRRYAFQSQAAGLFSGWKEMQDKLQHTWHGEPQFIFAKQRHQCKSRASAWHTFRVLPSIWLPPSTDSRYLPTLSKTMSLTVPILMPGFHSCRPFTKRL